MAGAELIADIVGLKPELKSILLHRISRRLCQISVEHPDGIWGFPATLSGGLGQTDVQGLAQNPSLFQPLERPSDRRGRDLKPLFFARGPPAYSFPTWDTAPAASGFSPPPPLASESAGNDEVDSKHSPHSSFCSPCSRP